MLKRGTYWRKATPGDIAFDTCNFLFMILLLIITLYPMLHTLAVSLNNAGDTIRGGIYLWPRIFTWHNYVYVFQQTNIFHALLVSVLRTVVGTAITIFGSAMVAYTISRPEFVLRKFVTITFVLTMYLNPGIIPTFLLIKNVHLLDSFWVYIFPSMISVFNMIIIRSFIEALPEGIIESARMDGAGEFTTFLKIALPLSLPALVTVGLFTAVFQWNNWFDVFLYNSSDDNLSTLQYELMKVLANTNSMSQSASSAFANTHSSINVVTPKAIRATMTIVASVPIIAVYPFLQKYFIKGMTIGGVKG